MTEIDDCFCFSCVAATMWKALTRTQDIHTVIKDAHAEHVSGAGLKKVLTVRDLVSFGISSTLGSGIFVTVGTIATRFAGPGLFLTFIVAGIGSLLSAYCYAEFASRLPVSGQSYTYSYVSLGEFVAFITGWLGFFSYAVSTAAVSRGWANYLDCFIRGIGNIFGYPMMLPRWLVSQPVPGWEGILGVSGLAAGLNIFCTFLGCLGIHESTKLSFFLVVMNTLMMIGFALYGSIEYGDVDNLVPLLPFGFTGIMKGSGLAFFCCIGWELVCTLSEEVKHPSRDLPRGIIGSLGIVTLIYCGVCLSLSLMVPYDKISLESPIADAFAFHGDSIGYLVIAFVCSTVCPPSVLTGIVGPPRILYKMAKDGLLYESFSRLNTHGAPVVATIVGGVIAAILGGILEFDSLVSACSAVTLFMFVIVCLGVVIVRVNESGTLSHASHLRSILGIGIALFCLFSFVFCSLCVQSDADRTWVYVMGFANVVSASVVIKVYQDIVSGQRSVSTTPSSAKSTDPLLVNGSDAVVITSVTRKMKREIFFCPMVPVLPLVAAWVDIFMMASLGIPALGGLIIMLVGGMFVYFSYGINNSKLR